MARVKRFIGVDVLTAARQRIRHIYDTFDTVVVCFSGGKDSLACLHLAREVVEERGLGQVQVLFRDEELIPQTVIDFVDSYRAKPWVDMRYFALRSRSTQFILGRTRYYVQWDRSRRHIRPMPEHAITQPDDRLFDPNAADEFTSAYYRGRVAFVTGVRAAESLTRWRACVNKLNENYITATKSPRLKTCKPIFDWQENDLFKYFHDSRIEYCAFYDRLSWSGAKLRVSTPLHAEAAKHLSLLKRAEPLFYDQLLALFPETAVQERYWSELDRLALASRYGRDYEGCKLFVAGIEDPRHRALAEKMLGSVLTRAAQDPDGYPPVYVFEWLAGGAYHRECMAVPPKDRARYVAKAEELARRAT